MRPAAAALAVLFLAAGGCAHRPTPPAAWLWDLPVYPGATLAGKSAAAASFVLYRTGDSLDDVYAWYLAELPQGTPHAYSSAKHQATFALFDAHAQRSVHLQSAGSSTAIVLTRVIGR